jgi:hypothetical protein
MSSTVVCHLPKAALNFVHPLLCDEDAGSSWFMHFCSWDTKPHGVLDMITAIRTPGCGSFDAGILSHVLYLFFFNASTVAELQLHVSRFIGVDRWISLNFR